MFSGPIYSKKDPVWRGIRVPLRFFKIVARVEDGELVATALIADQSEQVAEILETQEEAKPEAYDDWAAMPKSVKAFHRSVADVEQLTGLDFGPLRAADRSGESSEPLPTLDEDDNESMEELLSPKPALKRSTKSRKTTTRKSKAKS